MTDEDATTGTDSFLAKHGPPSLEFPYHRDEYYMLYDPFSFSCHDQN
jgi:hypothetical protein